MFRLSGLLDTFHSHHHHTHHHRDRQNLDSHHHHNVILGINCLNPPIAFRVITVIFLLLASASLTEMCQFPAHWTGDWFQKGYSERIRISGNVISEKGNCTANDNYKFLIESRQEGCVRCMAIYEKHANVLQYKESNCSPRKDRGLTEICNEINGDAPLSSLFRLDTPAVPCPFHGYYQFTYNRGHGECRDPPSTIDSCTDENHLLFRFQACADVKGSESRVVTLECYAVWKSGNSLYYLVGKYLHPSAKTEEDRFRCFVYEQTANSYHIAQSPDASCEGLEQTSEGSPTMELIKTERLENRCAFPDWAVEPRFWQNLNRSHVYDFGGNTSFTVYNKLTGALLRFANCTQEEPNSGLFVVHSTSGCDIGYVCMKIVKRNDNIIEILIGDLVKSLGDACMNFNKFNLDEYVTLTEMKLEGSKEESRPCPLEGIYDINVHGDEVSLRSPFGDPLLLCSQQSTLASQCESPHHMHIESSCGSKEPTFKALQCSGQWKENGTNFLLAYSAEDDIQYCLSYSEADSRAMRMTVSSVNCRPNKKAHHRHYSNSNNNNNNDNYENNYDYNRNSHLFNYDLTRVPNEGIHFDLVNKGLCHATGQALSNFHINQNLMLNLPIGTLLILLITLLNNIFSSMALQY